MRKTATIFLFMVLTILMFNGCNSVENGSTSGTILYIQSITGNDLDNKPGSDVIYSDVLTNGAVINDVVVMSVVANLLDPDAEPSTYQDVIIDQIDVSYSLPNGQNVEGRDVPRSHSVRTSKMVRAADTETTLSFEIVRHIAKTESPLVELINIGGSKVLSLQAKVTVHSKDTGGNRLAPAVAVVSVQCSNFADSSDSSDSGN